MKLKDYLETSDPEVLAKAVGTKPVYFSHLIHGHRNPSVKLVKKIEAATKGAVTRFDLRPDIFGKAVA